MDLPKRLSALKRQFESGEGPWLMPRFAIMRLRRSITNLQSSGAAERALRAGDKAPPFNLEDADGNWRSSTDLLARGPLVVIFYGGAWCPYCNLELRGLQGALPAIARHGANLVALSPQSRQHQRRGRRRNRISFPLLIDRANHTAAAFGVRWKLQDYLVELHRTIFAADLEKINGEASWTLPLASRFVIGGDGTIVHAEVFADYRSRPDFDELLAAVGTAAVGDSDAKSSRNDPAMV